jgi:transcriptional regulator with XRE-family HTH domain
VDVGKRFGENLSRARHKAKLSQEEMAARASIHRTQVGLFETGKRLPKIDVAVKLANVLGTTVDSLVDGISWTPTVTEPGEFHEGEGKS